MRIYEAIADVEALPIYGGNRNLTQTSSIHEFHTSHPRPPFLAPLGHWNRAGPFYSRFTLPHHDFYVQLSDSLNSTYRDTDPILTNRLQLGQFVYLDQFIFDSPSVPLAANVRPIARCNPFIGTPEPLIAHILPSRNGFVIQHVSDSDHSGDPIGAYLSRTRKKEADSGSLSSVADGKGSKVSRQVSAPKENVNVNVNYANEYGSNSRTGSKKGSKRFSSPGELKQRSMSSGKKAPTVERDPSPAGKWKQRSNFPVPSKCVVVFFGDLTLYPPHSFSPKHTILRLIMEARVVSVNDFVEFSNFLRDLFSLQW
ncbi:Plant protein of unknown function (DUF936) [Abeliophyllum distichum]|uniref:DUF936 domain-containing protein n=1 Tax=Abeliophyllum distichum TaxID=126358 RepID=A0ABD1W2U9_9LAMI